jgi:hypothetical protein
MSVCPLYPRIGKQERCTEGAENEKETGDAGGVVVSGHNASIFSVR